MKAATVPAMTVLALAVALSACSMQGLAARMVPKGDMQLARNLFTDARKGDVAAETRLFAKRAAADPDALGVLHQLLVTGGKPELTGVNVSMRLGHDTHTDLTYEIVRGKQAYSILLAIRGSDGQRRLRSMELGRRVGLFTAFPGLRHVLEIISIVALGLLAVVAAAVAWLAGRRRARRRDT